MKIICVGRNYADHAKELHHEVPESPVIFMKPDTALLRDNQPFYHPSFSAEIHHELELVLRISRPGKSIAEKFASRYYDRITAGIDFTARDIQEQLKKKGLPWELAKAFDHSAVTGNFIPLEGIRDPSRIRFSLLKNNELAQQGDSADMIFSFNRIVSFVSHYFTLRTGDLIFTGTPAGVGKITPGDRLSGFLEDRNVFDFRIK